MKRQKDSKKVIIDLTETDEENIGTRSPKRKLENPQEAINNLASKHKIQKKDHTENNHSLISAQHKKCELKLINSASLKFESTKNKITFFDLRKKSDVNRFARKRRKLNKDYSYNFEFNKNVTKVKLYAAPVYAISKDRSQFGIFATEKIMASTEEFKASDYLLAYYAGLHCKNDEEENENSNAVFQVVNKNGQISDTIDGEREGDWTSLVNGGQNANIYVTQDDQSRICFRIGTDVEKDQQLILDYGPGYKKKLGNQYLYLNPDDNWHSPEEIYSNKKNRKFYAEGIYHFDPDTTLDLDLDPNLTWLIPSIFIYILENDIENLKRQLDQGCPPDLFAYACDNKNKISDKQQHLTGLMLACYLGHEKCISLLISYGANVDRLMLINGISPFALLLIGHTDTSDVSTLGLDLLKQMRFPFVTDKNDLSLLHYAIRRNSPILVAELIKIANEENHDFYSSMFSPQINSVKHIEVDDCIINNQFDILKILLLDMLDKGLLVKKFQEGLIFRESTFSRLDFDLLNQLHLMFINDFKTDEKNYLLEALNIYTLTLMGKIPFFPNKISPLQEVHFLKRMLNFSTNLENLDLFLNHVNPQYYFDKCLSHGIDTNQNISPLEFVLEQKPQIAIHVLKHMTNYIERCDFQTSYHLLHKFDIYSCLRLAVKKNLEDVYDGIMNIYKHHDNETKLITLLLSQAIENFKPTTNDHYFFEKLFNDANYVYELRINEEQKISLIQSFINFCKTKQDNTDESLSHCKFILDCIEKNYSFKEKTDRNLPLIMAFEDLLPPAFICLLLNDENIDIIKKNETNDLIMAIKNSHLQQTKFLLRSDIQPSETLLNYAKHHNCSPEIIQCLENEISETTDEKFPVVSSLNSTDAEFQDAILSDNFERHASFFSI